LITLDPKEAALQIQRLNDVTEGRADSMQLWALAANGQPRSLGILASKGKTLRLPVNDKALVDVSQLAISVENKDETTQRSQPSLPYLFKGAVVQKAL
jgi:anti-sigma-K factor RskA